MADRELSRKPNSVRRRLQHGSDPARDMPMLGIKPMDEWDWEELARGRPRNSRGSFSGSAPKWITAEVQAEAMRRLKENVFGDLMALLPLVPQAMRSALVNGDAPKNQLAAAMWLAEQLLGKAVSKVSLEGKVDVHQAIASAIVLDDGQPQGHLTKVIEGEYDDVEREADQETDILE